MEERVVSSRQARTINNFKNTIWDYYQKFGRHNLPWRKTTDPYKILISEIMLQQTQVERVLKKYPEFLEKFPDFSSLTSASIEQVLRVWQGMGYNRRALYLKKIAEQVIDKFDGILPFDSQTLETFPGIGKNTAGAIIAFSFNKPIVFIETNIRRVFIHFYDDLRHLLFELVENPSITQSKHKGNFSTHSVRSKNNLIDDRDLLELIEQTLDEKNPREWYFVLMDYGSMLKKSAGWRNNPNRKSKHYIKQSKFEGSNRQVRSKIIKLMLVKQTLTEQEITKLLGVDPRIQKNLLSLTNEGFLEKSKEHFRLPRKSR